MNRIRVVLADDHALVLQGLVALLELEPDLEIVATCRDGLEAIKVVFADDPDVVVLDQTMPGKTGTEVMSELAARYSRSRVILLTASLTDGALAEAIRAGVSGIVLKEAAVEQLVRCIHLVHAGEKCVPRALSERILEAAADAGDEDGLTNRERQVLRRVRRGHSNKRIGRDLGISEGTVKAHLHQVFKKLGVRSRVELVIQAPR